VPAVPPGPSPVLLALQSAALTGRLPVAQCQGRATAAGYLPVTLLQ